MITDCAVPLPNCFMADQELKYIIGVFWFYCYFFLNTLIQLNWKISIIFIAFYVVL